MGARFLSSLFLSLFCDSVLCDRLVLQSPCLGREKAGCFALAIFRMPCDRQSSVALPRSAVGWSQCVVVGIS